MVTFISVISIFLGVTYICDSGREASVSGAATGGDCSAGILLVLVGLVGVAFG